MDWVGKLEAQLVEVEKDHGLYGLFSGTLDKAGRESNGMGAINALKERMNQIEEDTACISFIHISSFTLIFLIYFLIII